MSVMALFTRSQTDDRLGVVDEFVVVAQVVVGSHGISACHVLLLCHCSAEGPRVGSDAQISAGQTEFLVKSVGHVSTPG